MTKNQRLVASWQKRAKKEIERLRKAGQIVSSNSEKLANEPIKERYTKREMEKLHDLLSVSLIRLVSKIKSRVSITQKVEQIPQPTISVSKIYTEKATVPVYKKDNQGNIITTNGRKEFDLQAMKLPEIQNREIMITDINAGDLFYKAAKRIEKHPSRDTANYIYLALEHLERTSGIKIFPEGVDQTDLQQEIMKYVPSPERINEIARIAASKVPYPASVYNEIGNQIVNIAQKAGLSEFDYAGKIKEGWEEGKKKAGVRFGAYIKKSSTIETIYDFFERSGSNWQNYRKKYGSDDFMQHFEEMETYYDDRDEEIDWDLFESKIEKQVPFGILLREMKEEADKKAAAKE